MKPKLKIEQKALCLCPEWCPLGVQVATWDGKKFDYPDNPNPDNFDNCVTGYLPLDEYDNPTRRNYLQYKDGDNEMRG